MNGAGHRPRHMPRLVHLCHIYLLVSYVQLDNGRSPSKTIVFWITGLTQTASAWIKGAILIGGEGAGKPRALQENALRRSMTNGIFREFPRTKAMPISTLSSPQLAPIGRINSSCLLYTSP